jgi:hypothetical protein
MFRFLEQVYQRTKFDDLAGLLGSMSILEDGLPADRAIAPNWEEAVGYALRGGRPAPLELT